MVYSWYIELVSGIILSIYKWGGHHLVWTNGNIDVLLSSVEWWIEGFVTTPEKQQVNDGADGIPVTDPNLFLPIWDKLLVCYIIFRGFYPKH